MMVDRKIAPPVRPFDRLVMPAEIVEHLPNGITLHYYDGGSQDVTMMYYMMPMGVADASHPALPTLMTRLMRLGSAGYSGEALADGYDYNCFSVNNVVDAHYCGFSVAAINGYLDAALPLFADMVQNPVLDEAAFEGMRRRYAVEVAQNRSRVATIASDELTALLAGRLHPLARYVTAENVAEADISAVRDFYREASSRRGVHVFIGGRLGDGVIERYRDMLMSMPAATQAAPAATPVFEAEPPQRVVLHGSDYVQAAVAMGLPAVGRSHADYNNLRLAVVALGGYFGSRLMSNIREEKGLTYGISASLSGMPEGAYIQIGAQCSNENVNVVIDEVKHEMCRLAQEPPRGEELERVKHNVSASLASTLDTPFTIIGYHRTHLLVGTPDDYFEAQLRAINALTPDVISEMAQRYMQGDDARIVVAGNVRSA